jgi:hypothetical protein
MNRNSKATHVDSFSQIGKILLEKFDDICTGYLCGRNDNTTGGTCGYSNHFLEGRVLEGLNGF